MNASSYVKTLWSCSGHLQFKPFFYNSAPYLALIVESHNANTLLDMIAACSTGKRKVDTQYRTYQLAYEIEIKKYDKYTTVYWWLEDHSIVIYKDLLKRQQKAIKKLSELIKNNNWKKKLY